MGYTGSDHRFRYTLPSPHGEKGRRPDPIKVLSEKRVYVQRGSPDLDTDSVETAYNSVLQPVSGLRLRSRPPPL